MTVFTPGLELAESYYFELVQPLLVQNFPNLRYSAALIGYGSEVLGFDTEMSMDHAWSPRMQIFVDEHELNFASRIDAMLTTNLPTHFRGFPLGVRLSDEEPGVFFMDENAKPGKVNHKVVITSLRDFVQRELNWDINGILEPADWLTFPSQVLRVITGGRVFFDNLGDLNSLRQRLAFYPRDIWIYLLACGWDRIGQEQPLMQRAGYVGDELGSVIMSSRLVRDIMSLCFLMERQYAPYPKWFGTAFKGLQCASDFTLPLWRAQISTTWQARAQALGEACEILAGKHNALGLTQPLHTSLSSFHGRPFQVIQAEKFCEALMSEISEKEMVRIAKKGPLGSLDQFSDNTILRSDPQWRQALKNLYS
jgi:hypothetical protein